MRGGFTMEKISFQSIIHAFKTGFNEELEKVQAADARKAEVRASEFVILKLDEERVIQSAKNYITKEKTETAKEKTESAEA